MRPAFVRDIGIAIVAAALLFGGIYFYYTGMYSSVFKEPPETLILNPPMPLPGQNWAPPDPGYVEYSLVDNSTLYKNERLGFSMLIPKEVIGGNGACDEDRSQPYPWKVPMKAFEFGDEVYIAQSESWIGADGCEKVMTTKESLEEYLPYNTWRILGFKAKNEDEIRAWIAKEFDPSCGVTPLTESYLEGILEGEVDRQNEECLNFAHFANVIYFDQKNGRGVLFDFGQEAAFWTDGVGDRPYDNQMRASIRMEP